jgi:hypothetical protein
MLLFSLFFKLCSKNCSKKTIHSNKIRYTFPIEKGVPLGSKNRILLAILSSLILHKLRNIFQAEELYVTKAKLKKIEMKHPGECSFLYHGNFQKIIDNTIGTCSYKYEDTIINFVSIVDDSIYLFSISTSNYHVYLGTFFKSDKRKILKQCNENINFLSESKRKAFEEFI